MKLILSIKNIIGIALLALAGIFFYFYIWDHNWRYVMPTEKQIKKYRISEATALTLYQLMKDTHEIFEKHNIGYWIEGGTLLGSVRHEGIIPFDDDVDIGMMLEDEAKLKKILPEFEQLGYQVKYNKIYSICKKNCLDIFIFHQENNKFVYFNQTVRKKYPNDFFYDDELFPLKKYKFGEIEVYGPNNPKGNLDRQYPEWDKYAVLQCTHSPQLKTLTNIELKTKFILTPALLEPAQPLGPLVDRVEAIAN